MKRKVWLLFAIVAFNLNAQQQEELILDLSDVSAESYSFSNLDAQASSEGIEVTVQPGAKGIITFKAAEYWNLLQHVYLSLELENLTNQELRFDPKVLYVNPRTYKNSNQKIRSHDHIGFLQPNENLEYNCLLIRDQIKVEDYPQKSDFPGMKGMPNGITLLWEGVDAGKITGLKIVFPAAAFEQRVLLKRIFKSRSALPELYVQNKEAFFPFINEYGQYKHGTWEGKITADAQFAKAIEKEATDIAAHPGSLEWNEFGGFKNGPTFEATGHFRTQKIDGKWWIVDPTGHLFWSTGVNGAGKLEVLTPVAKREHFFESLPKHNVESKAFWKKNNYLFGKQNLYKKYGNNSEDTYLDVSLERMKSWGLNTLGGWSNEDVANKSFEQKLPYTVYINATYPGINEKFPDVFDPKWAEDVEKKVKEKSSRVKDDPYFFGFFINNEIHWGNPVSLAQNSLAKGPKSVGKKVYVDLLKKELGAIEKFNEATGSKFKSWDALLQTKVKKGAVKFANLREINVAHYRHMVETYFSITKDLIEKYAPGKMYLGCRWHGNHKNDINVPIAAKYLDILTFNAYENEVEFYPFPQKNVDKPFIVSEFNFGALDRGKFFPGLGYASSQRNRGEKYVNFIQGAMRNPRCVGAHWFMWANSTTAGRGNGENANCGLVDMTDQVYYELIEYMRTINYKIYQYRL